MCIELHTNGNMCHGYHLYSRATYDYFREIIAHLHLKFVVICQFLWMCSVFANMGNLVHTSLNGSVWKCIFIEVDALDWFLKVLGTSMSKYWIVFTTFNNLKIKNNQNLSCHRKNSKRWFSRGGGIFQIPPHPPPGERNNNNNKSPELQWGISMVVMDAHGVVELGSRSYHS